MSLVDALFTIESEKDRIFRLVPTYLPKVEHSPRWIPMESWVVNECATTVRPLPSVLVDLPSDVTSDSDSLRALLDDPNIQHKIWSSMNEDLCQWYGDQIVYVGVYCVEVTPIDGLRGRHGTTLVGYIRLWDGNHKTQVEIS